MRKHAFNVHLCALHTSLCPYGESAYSINSAAAETRHLSVSRRKDVLLLTAQWPARHTVFLFIYTLPLHAELPV